VRSQRQLPRCCIAAWFERTASQQTWEGEKEDFWGTNFGGGGGGRFVLILFVVFAVLSITNQVELKIEVL
jgi:hypothetical protein